MLLDAKKEKGKAYTIWCEMEMFENYFRFFLLLVGALIFELLLWIVFECRNKWLISWLDWTGGPFEISSPAGACLCRNLNKCVGNTYHFHDTAKITFEVCHSYVIKIHTDKKSLKPQFSLNWGTLVHLESISIMYKKYSTCTEV